MKSILCSDYNDVKKHFHSISSKLKVLKPQYGTRSQGIFISKDIPQEKSFQQENFPYLLQEFLDTSNGFYNFPGMHDFRVVMLNGEIICKFLRQPEKGKYTANSFRRGGLIDLKDWEIPEELQSIISQVENYCSQKFEHRYYSIDFGIGKDHSIKIFEINSAPGLTNKLLSQKLGHYISKNILKVS